MACRERAQLVYKMLWMLKQQGIEPTVIWDEQRQGPWKTAKRFWEQLEADYGVLLQDDVFFNESFRGNVEGIVSDGEVDTVAVGHWGNPKIKTYHEQGHRWIYPTTKVWGQCIIGERGFIKRFLEWGKDAVNPKSIHDDARIAMYCADHGERAQICVPSIVGHYEGPSMAGNPSRPFGRAKSAPVVAEEVYDWKRAPEMCLRGIESKPAEFDSMRKG